MTEREFLLEIENQDRPTRNVRSLAGGSFLSRLRSLRQQGCVDLVQGEETSLRITGAGRALLARGGNERPGIRRSSVRRS